MFASVSSSPSPKASASPSNQNIKNKRKATRVQWACFNCRKRKQGCDSVRPCRRCVEKGIPCVEVESKRRRGRMKKEDALLKSSKLNEAGMEISSSPQTENASLQLDDSNSSSDENSSFEDDENEMSPEEEPSTPHHTHSKQCKGFYEKVAEANSGSSMNIVSTSQQQYHYSGIGTGPLSIAAPKGDKSSNLSIYSQSPMIPSFSELQMVTSNGSSVFALNLGLMSPFMENFAMSSEKWLGNYMESYPSDLSLSSMCFSESNYDFLGNLFSGEIHSLDHFGPSLSGNPDNCSLEFCYKLLYQRLSLSETCQKTYSRIKETWKEILVSLRNLEWKKAQSYIADLDSIYILASEPVFRNSPSVVMWSPGGRIQHANNAFSYLSGYSLEELKVSSSGFDGGKINANHLFQTTEITKILQKQLEAFQNSKSCVCSFLMRTKLLTKSKQEISISCSINNLRDSFGVPILTTMLILT